MIDKEIKAALQEHALWVKSKDKGARFNSDGLELPYVNLKGASLSYAVLKHIDLEKANLSGADLEGADFRGAHLRFVNLRGANLSFADLRRADLEGADLEGAYIEGANLEGANLAGAKGKPFGEPRAKKTPAISAARQWEAARAFARQRGAALAAIARVKRRARGPR